MQSWSLNPASRWISYQKSSPAQMSSVPCAFRRGRARASSETRVVAGAVDNSAAAIGSGAVRDGEAHLYIGTSSWIGAHVPSKKTDLFSQIVSIPCAIKGRYLTVAIESSAGSNLSFCATRFSSLKMNSTPHARNAYSRLDRIAATVPPAPEACSTLRGFAEGAVQSTTPACAVLFSICPCTIHAEISSAQSWKASL